MLREFLERYPQTGNGRDPGVQLETREWGLNQGEFSVTVYCEHSVLLECFAMYKHYFPMVK